MSLNCISNSLTPYTPSVERPWNLDRIKHLYRRMSYGISPTEAQALLSENPADIVDVLINDHISAPIIPPPEWADEFDVSSIQLFAKKLFLQTELSQAMLVNGLRDKMTLFWSNHFVTDVTTYRCPSWLYRYTKTLQENALGNFKTFVHEIGIDSAMLNYLNGKDNKKGSPNENYARELYELFTLGDGNGYEQADIEETARALTGYTAKDTRCSLYTFNSDNFDDGEKTIFGRTGNWGYSDVIDILFEERGEHIAKHIVERIYLYFVHPELPQDESIINDLAQNFRDNDFEMIPFLRQLFKSEHFFSDDAMHVFIKSPYDLLLGLLQEAQLNNNSSEEIRQINLDATAVGQDIFAPPSVEGWQGEQDWISAPLVIGRWSSAEDFISRQYRLFDKEKFRDLGLALSGGQHEDVAFVSRAIIDWFLPKDVLSAQEYINGLETFKSVVPENYFTDGTWNLQFYPDVPKQVELLLYYITKLPEFQLK
ncbi:DUF1800 domain-containing protein [Maribacter sp. IgM3_T14_3]|uniref:DUF1800 domain-containing protein n=1 Tax=Maribacter sp. IgM3_T14_3 TaxID=3415140 RepID=UPI003C6F4411